MALITFKSKAAGDLIMFTENAQSILKLIDKDVKQGIIMPHEIATIIPKIEAEIARKKVIEAKERLEREEEIENVREKIIEQETKMHESRNSKDYDDEKEEKVLLRLKEKLERLEKQEKEFVTFSARAFPFMEMLRRSQKKEKEIVWGV